MEEGSVTELIIFSLLMVFFACTIGYFCDSIIDKKEVMQPTKEVDSLLNKWRRIY